MDLYGTGGFTLPIDWLTDLATTPLRLAIYSLRGLYGVARFLHLVGMGGFLGLVVLFDCRGLGLFPPGALNAARPRLGRMLNWFFWLTIATGVALFLRDPIGVGLHTMFLPKLVLVAAGFGFSRWVRPRLPGRTRQASAGLSLAMWVLVIGASTWNHVERPVRVTDALRLHTLGK